MGVSPRHTRRILADYRKNGAASLAHGHRGRKPANAIPEATRSRVVHLARTVYEGANHTHLSELLSERVGLDMGRTTLRRILVNAGLSSPRRRRPPKHRVRRQRMPREGMLIQMDGSYHRWASRTAAWTSPGEKCSNSRSTWTNSRLPLVPSGTPAGAAAWQTPREGPIPAGERPGPGPPSSAPAAAGSGRGRTQNHPAGRSGDGGR